MAGVAVSAQEVGTVDAGLALVDEVGVALDAGTVVASSESVNISLYMNDPGVKTSGCNTNDFDTFVFGADGTATVGTQGITGTENPTPNPAQNYALPTEKGFCFTFTVGEGDGSELAGYMYICSKMSANKNYWVWEDNSMVGFSVYYVNVGDAVYSVDFNGDPANYNRLTPDYVSATYADYFTGTEAAENPSYIPWLANLFGQSYANGTWENGMGVIKFAVYKGLQYAFGAGGSKLSLAGFYFSPNGDERIMLRDSSGTKADLVLNEGSNDSAISSVESAAEVVAEEYYTVSGVRVAEMVPGLNLVKQTLSDGSVKTVKVIK